MPQPLHFNLDIIKLTSSAVVVILGPIRLQKLLPEHLDLLFGSICALHLHMRSILSCSFVPLRHVNHLLIMGPLLGRLKLKATPLLFKIPLDAITLLSEPLRIPVLRLLPIELFLSLKSLVLLLEAVLYFLFDGLLPGDGLLLHPPLHLVKLALQLLLFLHDLLVVAIVVYALIVAKLALHVVSEQLEPLLILEPELLLEQVLLLRKLPAHLCLLLLEHLCEALLDEVTVVGELLFPLRSQLMVLA